MCICGGKWWISLLETTHIKEVFGIGNHEEMFVEGRIWCFSGGQHYKIEMVCHTSPSLGVQQVDVSSFINIYDMGFYLKELASKSRRPHTSCWVRYQVHYCRGGPKLNLIMAIVSGDPRLPPGVDSSIQKPRYWVHILQVNCNQNVFGNFVGHRKKSSARQWWWW